MKDRPSSTVDKPIFPIWSYAPLFAEKYKVIQFQFNKLCSPAENPLKFKVMNLERKMANLCFPYLNLKCLWPNI